ncbi:hypothetical protein KJ780_01565 [Candidatus Micrarchaeota archaeon]|nr:hypothetical protein [Candidatus Micrarchaeota archaeon]
MYIQEIINETKDIAKSKKMNFVFVFIAMFLMYIPMVAFGIVLYVLVFGGATIGSAYLKNLDSTLQIIGIAGALLVGLVIVALLFAYSFFFNTYIHRAYYLTYKRKDLPLTQKQFFEIFDYSKKNWVMIFKLGLVNAALVAIPMIIIGILAFVLLQYTNTTVGLIAMYAGIFALIPVYLVVHAVMTTAILAFFMGREDMRTLELVKLGWNTFISNIVEYVILFVTYVAIYVVMMIIYYALAFTCILAPVGYALIFVFGLVVPVAFFVFIGKLIPDENDKSIVEPEEKPAGKKRAQKEENLSS